MKHMDTDALRASYERIWSTTDMYESRDYYARCLDLASARAGERILDVACGGGYLLAEAERRGLAPSGIDIADAALARARTAAPSADLRRGEAEHLPYAEGSFDLVTCLGSLEHFLDPPAALEEMRRVLAPGGRAVVAIPNQFFAYDFARGWLEGTGLSHGQESERYFSIGEARALVGSTFDIRDVWGYNPSTAHMRETRPFTGPRAALAFRVYGWLRPRLPLAISYLFVFVGALAPEAAPSRVSPATDDVIPAGWHEREGRESRWTADRAGVWLRCGAGLRASLLNDDDRPMRVGLLVERERVADATLEPHRWTDVRADVPARYRGTVQRVFVDPARTWSPVDRGTRDLRQLGVSVREIASQ